MACILFLSLVAAAVAHPVTELVAQASRDAETKVTRELIEAKVDYLIHVADENKEHIVQQLSSIRESVRNVFAKPETLGGAIRYYAASLTERGRHLQTIEQYGTDVTGLVNRAFGGGSPAITSMEQLFTEFQGLTCDGSTPKTFIVSALDSLVESNFPTVPGVGTIPASQIQAIVTAGLNCACARQWSFTAPEYGGFWSALQPMINGDTSQPRIRTLIDAGRAMVPLIMGSSGMCGSTCQTSFRTIYETTLSITEAASGVTIPTALRSSFPTEAIACQCNSINFAAVLEVVTATRIMDVINSAASNSLTSSMIFDFAGLLLDTIFGPAFMCSSSCARSWDQGVQIGTYVGVRQGLTSARQQIGPDFPTAVTTSLAPSLSAIAAFSTPMVGCFCSLNYTTMLGKAAEYATQTTWSTSIGGVLRMVNDTTTTVFSGAPGSGGWCETGQCMEMVGRMMSMFSDIGVAAMTSSYGSPPFVPVTSGMITVQQMDAMMVNFPHCLCAYFEPSNLGDLFPMILSRLAGVTDVTTLTADFVIQTARLAYQASGMSSSGACRQGFSTLFSVVDKMSTANGAAAGVLVNGASACSIATAQRCLEPACGLVPTSGSPPPTPADCSICRAVPEAPQVPPMSHLDDVANRIMYWMSCYMDATSPPAGVSAYTLETTLTMAGTVESFQQQAESFKRGFALKLAPVGSSVEGAVTKDMISLSTTSGSVTAVVSVHVDNEAVRTTVTQTMTSLTPATASFGSFTVQALTPPQETTITFSPPSPPPAPGADPYCLGGSCGGAAPAPPGDDDSNIGMIIGIAAGAGGFVVILIIIVVVICCVCKKKAPADDTVVKQHGDAEEKL